MARPLRVEFSGALYHVMARANERRMVFARDADRQLWLATLAEMVEGFGVVVHCYCIMGNHYHLVVATPSANLSAAMGWFQTTFTVRFNRRRRRSGHLFQGRFKAQVVEEENHAQELLRYVHLNPVRIGTRKGEPVDGGRRSELAEWKWSSHRAYAGMEKPPSWLSLQWLTSFGARRREAQRRYCQFVDEAFEHAVVSPFEALRAGLVLGGEKLWEQVSGLLRRKPGDEELCWIHREVDIEEARRWVRDAMGREPDRRLKAWLMVRFGQWRRVDVARKLGYSDGSAITHLLRRLQGDGRNKRELGSRMERWSNAYTSRFKS
jgi:putative transposase